MTAVAAEKTVNSNGAWLHYPRTGNAKVESDRPLGHRLSRSRIIDAAVALAARDGLDQLSIRKLAGHLGVEAMSLYYHIPSKASLIALMADRTLAEVGELDSQAPWTDQLIELLLQTFQAGINNPAVLPILASEPLHPHTLPAAHNTGTASLGLLEQVLQLLQQARLPVHVEADAFRGLIGITMGFIAGQVDGLLPKPTTTDTPTDADHQHRAAAAPLLTRITPNLRSQNPIQALRFSLQLYVASLDELTSPGDA